MLLVQDATTATQRSSNASSIVSAVRTQENAPEAFVGHVMEKRRRPLSGICQVISSWLRRRKDRATLRSFSVRDIHDFCPRHTEAEAEMNKPFWRM